MFYCDKCGAKITWGGRVLMWISLDGKYCTDGTIKHVAPTETARMDAINR